MSRSLFLLGLLLYSLGIAVPASADLKPEEQAQLEVEFGIRVAREGLWQEAIYRWEKAVELDPENAKARNNLGVAYEQAGKFELADEAYKKALEIDAENTYIRQNYELFRETYEKRKRKEGSGGTQP